jgi:dihydropteroate synthase
MPSAGEWRCGVFRLALDRPLVMGILNVTPDSFSDGGRFGSADDAVSEGGRMVEAGADILDVGGESTRPGAPEVDAAEETSRVLEVVQGLVERLDVPVSIDTRKSEVARVCVEAGASIMNDVSGFRDPAMVEVVAGSDVGCVAMHMRGEPGTMQDEPVYGDVVRDVGDYLTARAEVLEGAGVARERIVVDPGIGFGKTVEHNLELLGRLPELVGGAYPVLVGASRKSFIGAVLGRESGERLVGSLAAATHAAMMGAAVLRVHDVRETVEALTMLRAVRSGRVPG